MAQPCDGDAPVTQSLYDRCTDPTAITVFVIGALVIAGLLFFVVVGKRTITPVSNAPAQTTGQSERLLIAAPK